MKIILTKPGSILKRNQPVFKSLLPWLSPFVLSFLICLSIFFSLQKDTVQNSLVATSVLLTATFVIAILIHVILWDRLVHRVFLLQKKWSLAWVFLCFLAGLWLVINIPLPTPPAQYNPFISASAAKAAFRFSAGVGIGFLLFSVSVILAGSPSEKIPITLGPLKLRTILKYALPMIVIWGLFLLAFFPGMMSADSMVQWGQVLSGQYNDHHPVFHTLLIWLVTRISLSPATVAATQIIALALVAGAWLAFFEQIGIRPYILWIAAAIFSLSPVNGTMVNTLWKDVPYGIAVVGMTLILARIIYSHSTWANRWGARVVLGVTIACVSLLRHDGLVLGAGTLILLASCYPTQWKSWLSSGLLFIILYLGIKGPLYTWVGVEKSTVLTEASFSLFDMAAYSVPGSEVDTQLASMSIYPSNWNCDVWSNVDPNWRVKSIDKSQPVSQIVKNLVKHLPKVFAYDYRCERSMEWIIWDPIESIRNASHVEVLVDPNPFGLQAESKIPFLHSWIANWVVKTSKDTSLNWLVWRPAIFLYITIFINAVILLRNRDIRFGLLSVPVLLQAITFTLIPAPPNFRYHYATYLVALIALPLLFLPFAKKVEQRS